MSANYLYVTLTAFCLVMTSCDSPVGDNDQLSSIEPEAVGMDAEQLTYIDTLFQDYLDTKRFGGGVALVLRNNKLVKQVAFGHRDIQRSQPQQLDDLFRIASMTKAVTAVAALQLLEKGKYSLDDPLWWFIPAFRNPKILESIDRSDSTFTSRPASNEIKIRHLFNHTSGIAYGFDVDSLQLIYHKLEVSEGFEERDISLEENVKRIASLPIMHESGKQWTYGLSYDVLGRLIEIWSGVPLDQYLQANIFDPLGMSDTHFYLPESKHDRLSEVFMSAKKGVTATEYPLVNYPVSGAQTYLSGGADLTSTALDYVKFASAILNNGEFNGARILSRKTTEWMRNQQLEGGPEGVGWGLGVVTAQDDHKLLSTQGSYYWGGFFGTQCLVDPEERLIAILMIQQYPNWEWSMHDRFHNIVYSSLVN